MMYIVEIRVDDTFVYYKVKGYDVAVDFARRVEALRLGTVRITTGGVNRVFSKD